MRWKSFGALPPEMQTEQVKPYYETLARKTVLLFVKRGLDVVLAFLALIVLSPMFLVLAIAIKADSQGPVFFRQERITQYGKPFRIYKFRTMRYNAAGRLLTAADDNRITGVGRLLRRTHLDELGQLINVLRGEMTFVGTRPEVPKYVEAYTPEMRATLLLPAGITSRASVYYKDEERLLTGVSDIDTAYVATVLPGKMNHNLAALKRWTLWEDIRVLFMTVMTVFGKEYSTDGPAEIEERENVTA